MSLVKKCSKCSIEKPLDEFYKHYKKSSGVESSCKECFKERTKNYVKNNKEKVIKTRKQHYIKNKVKIRANQKNYYTLNKEEIQKNNKNWIKLNKKRYYKARLLRHKELLKDPVYKLKYILKQRLRKVLKTKNFSKKNSIKKYIGCTPDFLRNHLETQFKPEMNWGNHYKIWHIDHVIPLSSAKTEEELYKLCHYTNLQPLFVKDNLKKSNKILCQSL